MRMRRSRLIGSHPGIIKSIAPRHNHDPEYLDAIRVLTMTGSGVLIKNVIYGADRIGPSYSMVTDVVTVPTDHTLG